MSDKDDLFKERLQGIQTSTRAAMRALGEAQIDLSRTYVESGSTDTELLQLVQDVAFELQRLVALTEGIGMQFKSVLTPFIGKSQAAIMQHNADAMTGTIGSLIGQAGAIDDHDCGNPNCPFHGTRPKAPPTKN
jgi:hypothetical protein